MWITSDEKEELLDGQFPQSLAGKLARFHLIDNTRGEPPMWKQDELKQMQIECDDDGVVSGRFHLETADGSRGFVGNLRGHLAADNEQLTQFDLVASGEFWGQGRFTPGAPQGKFPFAVAFRLADGTDIADKVPPQGTKGWRDGYR